MHELYLGRACTQQSLSLLRLVVIDYEYAACNPAGYDIANHFNEHGGFAMTAADLVAGYPTRHVATHFLRAYVQACGDSVPTMSANAEDEVSATFFAELYDAIGLFALASHLFW